MSLVAEFACEVQHYKEKCKKIWGKSQSKIIRADPQKSRSIQIREKYINEENQDEEGQLMLLSGYYSELMKTNFYEVTNIAPLKKLQFYV